MQIEVLTDYYPKLTLWHVRRVMRWIDPVDVTGITSIRILGDSPDRPHNSSQSAYLTGVFSPADYERVNKHTSHINLYTKSLYIAIPTLLTPTPMATLRVALVLAHEFAHHLIAHKGYIHSAGERYKAGGRPDRNKELMANSYAFEVVRRMSTSAYYKIGQLMSGAFSAVCYELGYAAFQKKKYKRAAYYWFIACSNNPADQVAENSYRKAIQMLSNT
jgi:hypothetical protein